MLQFQTKFKEEVQLEGSSKIITYYCIFDDASMLAQLIRGETHTVNGPRADSNPGPCNNLTAYGPPAQPRAYSEAL